MQCSIYVSAEMTFKKVLTSCDSVHIFIICWVIHVVTILILPIWNTKFFFFHYLVFSLLSMVIYQGINNYLKNSYVQIFHSSCTGKWNSFLCSFSYLAPEYTVGMHWDTSVDASEPAWQEASLFAWEWSVGVRYCSSGWREGQVKKSQICKLVTT